MRIFVTGGTGLLGNTILRQLTETDDETVTLVRSTPEPTVFDGIRTEVTTEKGFGVQLGERRGLRHGVNLKNDKAPSSRWLAELLE